MWFFWALSCAFLHGTGGALSKRLLSRSNEWVVGWASFLFALPWLAIGLWRGGIPELSGSFWGLILFLVPFELTAFVCYLKAIRLSPLSLVLPYLALTPVLTLVTGWLFLGEQVSPVGFLGVVAVTVGAYLLQAELIPQGIFEPIKAMFREPGIRMMLVTATIYSVSAPLGKRAIEMSGPLAFPFIYVSLNTLALTVLVWNRAGKGENLLRALSPQLPLFLLAGLVMSGVFFTHCIGILGAPVTYFISIKRLSLLAGVLYGGLMFREEKLLHRALGCGLMLFGAGLISSS